MKRTALRVAVAAVFVAAISVCANASPILLNNSPLPGTQPTTPGQQAVADWLDSLTSADIGNAADLSVNQGDPAPQGYPMFGAGTTVLTLPAGDYDFLVLHWGSGPGTFLAYDLTLCPDNSSATFINPFGTEGLSAYRYYNPDNQAVPEPGTLALLGLGLAGVAMRRRSKT